MFRWRSESRRRAPVRRGRSLARWHPACSREIASAYANGSRRRAETGGRFASPAPRGAAAGEAAATAAEAPATPTATAAKTPAETRAEAATPAAAAGRPAAARPEQQREQESDDAGAH